MRLGLFVMTVVTLLTASALWPSGHDLAAGNSTLDWIRIVSSAVLGLAGILTAVRLIQSLRRPGRRGAARSESERRAGADRRKADVPLPPGMVDRRKGDRRATTRSAIEARLVEEGERRREIERLLSGGDRESRGR